MKRASLLVAFALASLTAAVALGAPARVSGPSPNQLALQQAFAKTAKVASGHFSFSLAFRGTGSNGYSVTGSGGFDAKHQAGTLNVNLGVLATVLGGAAGGVALPKNLSVVFVKNVVYVDLPSVATQIRKGAEWLRFDSSSIPTSVTKGVDPSQLSKINPQQALAKLTTAVTVHRLGKTTVRGASSTHYQAIVDVAKVVAILPKADQATELQMLKTIGLKTLPVDVYVDGSGYVRRTIVSTGKLTVQAGSPPLSIRFSADVYDFGAHVHASAPPAGTTADGGKLLSSIAAVLGG